MVYVTRKAHFSAAHRLFNPKFSDEKNEAVFDKCNNIHGHGHNYTLEVTVAGEPDPETGYVIDLKKLGELIEEVILAKVDHKHLNYDVPELAGIIPTAENIALVFWQLLEGRITDGRLHSVRVAESDNNYAEYRGNEE
jgi:6-pyruvoyltetrahydropterin/6-carboxytetrahydropterin synthase